MVTVRNYAGRLLIFSHAWQKLILEAASGTVLQPALRLSSGHCIHRVASALKAGLLRSMAYASGTDPSHGH